MRCSDEQEAEQASSELDSSTNAATSHQHHSIYNNYAQLGTLIVSHVRLLRIRTSQLKNVLSDGLCQAPPRCNGGLRLSQPQTARIKIPKLGTELPSSLSREVDHLKVNKC